MKALVYVKLKAGVLDPQGKAIGNALAGLGFTGMLPARVSGSRRCAGSFSPTR
jgi:phosphoribosylformylglycinamidine synthase